jgi:hypothetical protein
VSSVLSKGSIRAVSVRVRVRVRAFVGVRLLTDSVIVHTYV